MPAPATHDFVHLEISSASVLNTSVNGPLNYLIGRNLGSDDAIEIEDSLEIQSGPNGNRYLRLPQGTTAQRPTGAVGQLRFNSTANNAEIHNGAAWNEALDAGIVTYETLDAKGDVGSGAAQLAEGDHGHTFTISALRNIETSTTNTTLEIPQSDLNALTGDYTIVAVGAAYGGDPETGTITLSVSGVDIASGSYSFTPLGSVHGSIQLSIQANYTFVGTESVEVRIQPSTILTVFRNMHLTLMLVQLTAG